VYALGVESIVIGRLPAGPRTIALPEGLAGVSRRHCTLAPEGDDLVLLDHSSFGTFVNGERVAERVRVRAGDRVRLGDPGIELALIAVDEAPSGAG
jgi:pSer/pThr/pTyr-binding forkhead associated (FHA) protein